MSCHVMGIEHSLASRISEPCSKLVLLLDRLCFSTAAVSQPCPRVHCNPRASARVKCSFALSLCLHVLAFPCKYDDARVGGGSANYHKSSRAPPAHLKSRNGLSCHILAHPRTQHLFPLGTCLVALTCCSFYRTEADLLDSTASVRDLVILNHSENHGLQSRAQSNH